MYSTKITPLHLKKKAYVYVRQSSPRQVRVNLESQANQYALRDKAIELGWLPEQVFIIDSDLGTSGRFSEGRDGFKELVAEVSLGQVGIILGYEVSRLARNCKDWYQLLELCSIFGTLIVDSDGIYDLNDYNDRLLWVWLLFVDEVHRPPLTRWMKPLLFLSDMKGPVLFQSLPRTRSGVATEIGGPQLEHGLGHRGFPPHP